MKSSSKRQPPTTQEGRACRGRHLSVLLGTREDLPLQLAGMLAERETRGEIISVVTLHLAGAERGDLVDGLRWLDAHNRRPILRTRRVLTKAEIDAVCATRATVELELAHHRPRVQRALLGEFAAPMGDLLLQAQHLVNRGIPVTARVAPVFPGIHDEGAALQPLLRSLRAAAIEDLHFEVGELRPEHLVELTKAVDHGISSGGLLRLSRAFGLGPHQLFDPGSDPEATWSLRPYTELALVECARMLALGEGLRVDHCGCPHHCHLSSRPVPSHTDLTLARELF